MGRTLVLLEPDAVVRGLTGVLLRRLESAELTIEHPEMRTELIDQHYVSDEAWLASVGQKTLGDYEARGLDPAGTFENPGSLGGWACHQIRAGSSKVVPCSRPSSCSTCPIASAAAAAVRPAGC